jgi:hypothetical protein
MGDIAEMLGDNCRFIGSGFLRFFQLQNDQSSRIQFRLQPYLIYLFPLEIAGFSGFGFTFEGTNDVLVKRAATTSLNVIGYSTCVLE